MARTMNTRYSHPVDGSLCIHCRRTRVTRVCALRIWPVRWRRLIARNKRAYGQAYDSWDEALAYFARVRVEKKALRKEAKLDGGRYPHYNWIHECIDIYEMDILDLYFGGMYNNPAHPA